MKKLLFCFLLLVAGPASAEMWICYDVNMVPTKAVIGDCRALGLCSGFNNEGLLPNCFEATKEELSLAKQAFKKVDKAMVQGSRIVDMSQPEIDAIVTAQAQAVSDAETARVGAIDDAMAAAKVADKTMAKVDAAIDNIATLADAKVFLKKLVRYLAR